MDEHLPAVLLMGGGEGMGPIEATAQALGNALYEVNLSKPIDPEAQQLLEEKKKLGMQIVKKCKGLPLAIVVLGGLLAHKKTLMEWKTIEEDVETYFNSKNNEENGVREVLELSYTNLPYHLRPCFLHLGNFPEGYEIPTKKLYRMWMAEGIVVPRNTRNKAVNLEDTANIYLKELAQRCLVQVKTRPQGDKIKTCRLHGLMLDMCTSKAKEENFLYVVHQESMNDEGYDNFSAVRDGSLHRVVIHFGQSLQSSFPSLFHKAVHLRSLMFFASGPLKTENQGWLKTVINDFKLLRVLDLENTGIKEVPRMIGNLFLLKYLSIMGTQVKKLSSSIGNLRCLQTLDLRVHLPEGYAMSIPNVLWRMGKLRHLYLPSVDYKVKRFQKLRVKGLSNLEILKNFDTRRSQVIDLSHLRKLRKLSIKNEVTKIETLKLIIDRSSIKNNRLVHLSLKIHGAILDEDATVLSSCSCLHTLELAGSELAITRLKLESFIFPENLTILVIKNFEMGAIPMHTFKQLNNLKSMSLDTVSLSENCLDFTQGCFLELVDLKLSNMDTFKEWKVEENSIPQLHSLHIYNCKHKDLFIPDNLPASVEVVCQPCVTGIHHYLTCPFHIVVRVDDDDNDLATRQCKEYHS